MNISNKIPLFLTGLYLIVTLSFTSNLVAYANVDIYQTTNELNKLNTEISSLKSTLETQNSLLPEITQKINDLINKEILINDMWKNLGEIKDKNNDAIQSLEKIDKEVSQIKQTLNNIAQDTNLIKHSVIYKDVFVFNKEGKPALYVDDIGLWLYNYNTNELVGWIQADSNIVFRNDSGAPVGFIQSGYLLDKRGYPLGIIERSEHYRKLREKNFQSIARTIPPNLILREQAPRQFFALARPASSWSIESIEDLFFNLGQGGKKDTPQICANCN